MSQGGADRIQSDPNGYEDDVPVSEEPGTFGEQVDPDMGF